MCVLYDVDQKIRLDLICNGNHPLSWQGNRQTLHRNGRQCCQAVPEQIIRWKTSTILNTNENLNTNTVRDNAVMRHLNVNYRHHQIQITKDKRQNTICKMQNTKHKIQNTKFKVKRTQQKFALEMTWERSFPLSLGKKWPTKYIPAMCSFVTGIVWF